MTSGCFQMKLRYFRGNFPVKMKLKYNVSQTIRVSRAGTRLTVHRSLYIPDDWGQRPEVTNANGDEDLMKDSE